jgi:hypothetical protein
MTPGGSVQSEVAESLVGGLVLRVRDVVAQVTAGPSSSGESRRARGGSWSSPRWLRASAIRPAVC